MKLTFFSLTLALVAQQSAAKTVYSYNGYRNRQLERDEANLFGSRLLRHQKKHDAGDQQGNLRQRRTEGHVAETSGDEVFYPPETSEDEMPSGDEVPGTSGEDGDDGLVEEFEEREQQSFFEAETLSFFKKGIDPDIFEWVNPDEIVPMGWTCGFLKPELGTTPNLVFPKIQVYVCVRFADEQPAKKGNVFTHCGGPSSLSGCTIWDGLDEQALKDYNFLTIDQRGMGRSLPSFAQDSCWPANLVRADNGTIIDAEPLVPEQPPTDYTDVESIKASLEGQKQQTLNCWTKTEDFRLNATQEDGSTNNYHFLEYSGSRQLAEDIERIRMAFNAPVMHIYGVSYGTQVFGTYATIFPGSVGLMVLDGNVNPYQNLEQIAHDQGVGENTRISYALFSCSARNAEEPDSCPVDDLSKCVSDLNFLLASEGFQPGEVQKTVIGTVITVMLGNPDRAQEICDLAAEGDSEGVDSVLTELLPEDPSAAATRQLPAIFEPNSESGPSFCFPEFCDIIGQPEYFFLVDYPGTTTILVNAQDAFSALYDADYFARRVKEFGEFYTGSGTGRPVQIFANEWSAGFNWPKGVPLAPMGNPFLSGIIAGQLYDPATPYVWTMDMRQNFKFASLLTSQYTQHGLDGNAPDCQQHVIDYFTQGFIDFVDGTVCGADFGDESLLTGAFGISG